jgi:probable phosphoglycerate mutase
LGTVILIRHARSTANADGILAGQNPGIRLDQSGVEQSKNLARLLGPLPIERVFVSPLERCLETITPWLREFGNDIAVQTEPRIIEPDYGLWSGRKLEELATESLWTQVQQSPAEVTFPRGEKFAAVWERVADFYKQLQEISTDNRNFIVVSHGDIIKFLISNILKMEFNNFQSLVVEPGSITVAQFGEGEAKLLQYNRTDHELSSLLAGNFKSQLGGEQRQLVDRKMITGKAEVK